MSSIEAKEQEVAELAKELKPQHLLFANYHLDGMTQQEAYEAAKYKAKGKSAEQAASRLLSSNIKLARYLELKKDIASEKAATKLEVTEERIMGELAKLGFSNIQNYYDEEGNLLPPHKLTPEAAAAITEITTKELKVGRDDEEGIILEYKYKIADKKGSLELLGKSNAIQMFKERQVIEGGTTPLGFILERIAEQTNDNDSPLPSEC